MAGHGQRHRRVVPEHVVPNGLALDEGVQQRTLRCDAPLGWQAFWKMRDHNGDGTIDVHLEVWADVCVEQRLFDEEDPVFSRASRQQVLRALEHEVPPQMRETDDIRMEGAS